MYMDPLLDNPELLTRDSNCRKSLIYFSCGWICVHCFVFHL